MDILKKKERQKNLKIILPVIILLLIIILAWGYWPEKKAVSVVNPPIEIKEIKIDWDLLDSSQIKSLQFFEL